MRRGLFAVALVALFATNAASAPAAKPKIKTLSNRADLVSGGDVLVQVSLDGAKVTLNSKNVTAAFAVRPDGRYLGLLEGLRLGRNVVVARRGAGVARLVVRNHPIGGPVLAGPQIQPWTCFEGALDDQCNRDPTFSFSYKPAGGGPLRPYNPDSPPPDVATTTTDEGKQVPFIVRQETGAIDRDQYRVAALYDPSQPYLPTAPQDGFNHKLVITHGASCDTSYEQAAAPDVMREPALAKGFIVMSHALDNAGHNCNIATQAESLVMTKEHVIDTYGTVRYTIGTGCSGGSLTQQQVANAYPGLYQAITPACSFTDAWSSANQYVDYQLLLRYFENPGTWGSATRWTPTKMAAVEGHANPVNAVTFTSVIPSSGDPSRSCPGVPAADVYDADDNPDGVRCSLQDYMVNVFGTDARGFARRPYDNTGVQYGLDALAAGTITPAEFVDLNLKLGGWDIDYNATQERVTGDPAAIRRAYKSGAINQAENLDQVAIIDLRGPDPGAFHDVYRTYTMRARLEREHGTAANQVLWRGLVPLFGDAGYADEAIAAADRWLAAVEADRRRVPLSQKIIEDKPADVTERCTNGAGVDVDAAVCDAAVTAYSDPRQVSGAPPVGDIEKCVLKPLSRADYGPVTFTDEQFDALAQAFPTGVCDWSRQGRHRVPTVPWQTYQKHDGKVIYGGRGLGPAPRAKARRLKLAMAVRRSCGSGRLRVRVSTRGIRAIRIAVNGTTYRGRTLETRLGANVPVRIRAVALRGGDVLKARRTLKRC